MKPILFSGIATARWVDPTNGNQPQKVGMVVDLNGNERRFTPNRKALGPKFILTVSEDGKLQGYRISPGKDLVSAAQDRVKIYETKPAVTLQAEQIKPILGYLRAFDLTLPGSLAESPGKKTYPFYTGILDNFLKWTNTHLTPEDLDPRKNVPDTRTWKEKIQDKFQEFLYG